jgi:hypothetical protein
MLLRNVDNDLPGYSNLYSHSRGAGIKKLRSENAVIFPEYTA